MEELIKVIKVLAEVQVQQQRSQQCLLQEELIAIRKEQLEILKTKKGNSNFFYSGSNYKFSFRVQV